MLGFQTISCLHEIPVVHSSTTKLQTVYNKAKDTSVLIRFPCDLAETIVGKTLQVGLIVTAPFARSLSAPVHAVDEYAANKIRQIESKYPVINTSVDDVIDSLNDKTEPIRNAMNSVRGTTTLKIQHSKQTVSNVASATANKAACAADSLYSFYESHAPKLQRRDTSGALGLPWLRTLITQFLLITKQINDFFLRKIPRKQYLTVLPQRLLILVGTILEFCIEKIKPANSTAEESKRSRPKSQMPTFVNRHFLKSSPYVTSGANRTCNHNNSSDSRPRYANMSNIEESNGCLHSIESDEADNSPTFTFENNTMDDIEQLRDRLGVTDVELAYSQTPNNASLNVDDQEELTEAEKVLQNSTIRVEPELLGYSEGDNDNQDQQ